MNDMRLTFRRATAAFFSQLLLLLVAVCQPALAQRAAPPDRELAIGTMVAPPFAMKGADGNWQGISIELWRKVADDLKLRYRFVEVNSVSDLIDQTAGGKLDAAVGALTVTAKREQVIDFTPSYFSTGYGIAVPVGGEASWRPVVRAMTSFGFLQSILVLVGLALAVGVVVWLFERRHNEEFGGTAAHGLSSSVWWTTVAMTQRGIGSFGPRTVPGRAVAMFWMVGSIIAVAIFTASITSVLTVKQLRGVVRDVGDLSEVRVGSVGNTAAVEALALMQVRSTQFPSLREALMAVRAGTIDAVVYDRPLLGWLVNQEFRNSIELLDVTFTPQNYAFALTPKFPQRKQVGVSLLETTQSGWWKQLLFQSVGAQ
jgi:polar amino acid transport system substrate-binding protein